MTNIYLVRHGETDWNKQGKWQGRTDIPLNSNGIKQAESCGGFFKQSEASILISSPLRRAKETAHIINQHIRTEIVIYEDFIERSYGDAEGLDYEQRMIKYPTAEIPNLESRALLTNRVKIGLDKVYQQYQGKDVIIVSHGGVINTILHLLSNGQIGSGITKLSNGCISNIHKRNDTWRILTYNEISHLELPHY